MTGSTLLHIRHLQKSYGSHRVLEIDDWEITQGLYWIQGENGAGKSTLFRVLAGMLPYTASIVLDERYDLRTDPVEYRLRVSMGEAEPQYPAFLTPRDLIRFVARTRRAPQGQAENLSERFGVVAYENQPVGACSSGMVKKLSLVLSFLGNLRLIILDEPLVTIDAEARQCLFEVITEYRHQSVGFLISSHQAFDDQSIAPTQSFRIVNKTLVPF